MRENGGDIAVSGYPSDESFWQLHSVWDPTDRKTASRSATHLVLETSNALAGRRVGLPEGTVVIADNGTGDLLVLPPGDDRPHWWDHENGSVHPVTVDWS